MATTSKNPPPQPRLTDPPDMRSARRASHSDRYRPIGRLWPEGLRQSPAISPAAMTAYVRTGHPTALVGRLSEQIGRTVHGIA